MYSVQNGGRTAAPDYKVIEIKESIMNQLKDMILYEENRYYNSHKLEQKVYVNGVVVLTRALRVVEEAFIEGGYY